MENMTTTTLPPLELDSEQSAAVWRAAYEPTNASLATSELGSGKTLVAVEIAKNRGADTNLIIAPLGTRPGWEHTFARQGMDQPFYWIKNDKNRDEILMKLRKNEPGIFFIGIEYFVRLGWKRTPILDGKGVQNRKSNGELMWDVKRDKLWNLVYPDFIVLDESHKGSNRGTKTFKALQLQTGENYLNGAYKHAMSATPYGNKFQNAWSIPRWLWPDDDIVPRSFDLWAGQWAQIEYDPFSFSHKKIVGEKNPGAWYDSLPCHIHLEAPPIEVVEYDPVTKEPGVIYVIRDERLIELTPKQRKIYDALENDYLAWLGDNPLVVELPITLMIRQNQVSLGEPTILDDGVVSFDENCKSSTMDEITSIIQNDIDEESAVIFSASQKFNEKVVVPRLKKLGYAAETYDGTLSDKKKNAARERFASGETKYLAVVIEAGGTGLDGFQHATRNVIWASKSLNGVSNTQATGRVPRRGQEKTVREFFITRVDTRDEESYNSLAMQELARRRSLKGVNA